MKSALSAWAAGAIGGPFYDPDGNPVGWGEVDDAESVRAVHAALDAGITFFDTADVYGVGHSEEVLGEALKGRRDSVVLATKFGNRFDIATKQIKGSDTSPAYIRQAVEASLRRLGTDYIDLYQIHDRNLPAQESDATLNELDRLTAEGKIRSWGWSTNGMEQVRHAAPRENCSAIQNALNIFLYEPELQEFCEKNNLASINRSPLAMGLLSGKYDSESGFAGTDIRSANIGWMGYFREGKPNPRLLKVLDEIRELLTTGGRSLVQGALGWIWSVSGATVPIPGIRTAAQAEENARAMEYGALPLDAGDAITRLAAGALSGD